MTELEQQRQGKSSEQEELEQQASALRQALGRARDELRGEKSMRDEIQREMNTQLQALADQLN